MHIRKSSYLTLEEKRSFVVSLGEYVFTDLFQQQVVFSHYKSNTRLLETNSDNTKHLK